MTEQQMTNAVLHQRDLLGAHIRIMLDELCDRYGFKRLHREDIWGWPDWRAEA